MYNKNGEYNPLKSNLVMKLGMYGFIVCWIFSLNAKVVWFYVNSPLTNMMHHMFVLLMYQVDSANQDCGEDKRFSSLTGLLEYQWGRCFPSLLHHLLPTILSILVYSIRKLLTISGWGENNHVYDFITCTESEEFSGVLL